MDQQILDNLPRTRAEAADMLAKVAFARRMGFVKFAQGNWMQGVSDYFSNWQQADPQSFNTAMAGLTGAGIGGVGGAMQGLFSRRRKRNPIGSALSGALMGGAIGTGAGAAYQYGPDLLKTLTEGTGPKHKKPLPPPHAQTGAGGMYDIFLRETGIPEDWMENLNKLNPFAARDPNRKPTLPEIMPGTESYLSNPLATGAAAAGTGFAAEYPLSKRRGNVQALEDFLTGAAEHRSGKITTTPRVQELAGELAGTKAKGLGLHPIRRGPRGTSTQMVTDAAGNTRPVKSPGRGSMKDVSFSGRHAASVGLQDELARLAGGTPADRALANEMQRVISSGSKSGARTLVGKSLGRLRMLGYAMLPAIVMSIAGGGSSAQMKKYYQHAMKEQ